MITLGSFSLEHPFILAPMAGITDLPFRRLMRQRKTSLVISELISATAIHYTCRKTMDMVKIHEEEHPVGIQIFGNERSMLCQAARYAQHRGADFVDLNLGCSVPKVTKKGSGAALAREESKLSKILVDLVQAVNIPVSIKIRLGWDSESCNAASVIQLAANAGVQWVTVHGRTSRQKYSGHADWNAIRELKQISSIPIIGNGDLTTPEKALELFHFSGVDAVMIGRGCIKNPFIFQQCYDLWKDGNYSDPTLEDYLKLLADHKKFLEEHHHPIKVKTLSRKFLSWYASGFPDCHKFRHDLFQIHDPDEIWSTAFHFFRATIESRDAELDKIK